MAGRNLEELQKRYNSNAKPGARPPRGPRGASGPVKKPANTKAIVKRLFGYIMAYRWRIALAILCLFVSTGTSMAGSYMLRPIINNVANGDLDAATRIANLGGALALLGLVYVFGIVATYCQSRLMIGVSQNAIEKIRNDLFNKVQALPVRFYDTENNGEVMSRFTNDVDNIGMMLDNSLMSIIQGGVTLVGTFAMMVYTNIWLTLITVAFTPIFMKLGSAIGAASHKYYSAQQAALGAVNGYIEETVNGQKVVKVFNHEDICKEEFGTLNSDLRDKQMKASFFGGIMGPIMGNTSQISYSVTAGVGGVLCALGKFDVGGLAVFVNYARQFSQPINTLSMQVSTIFSALAGAERVFNIMDREPEAADAPDAIDNVPLRGDVVLDHVTFGYNPDKVILKSIYIVMLLSGIGMLLK